MEDNPDGISLQPPPPTFCRLRRFLRSKQKVGGGFGLFPVRSPLLRESLLVSFPPATEMFHFAGFASPTSTCGGCLGITLGGFPHSGIPGSKVASHLPRAYRRLATPFIASGPRGIHHLPLKTLISIPCSGLLCIYYQLSKSFPVAFKIHFYPFYFLFSLSLSFFTDPINI